jgi:hypothetical protein
MMAYQRGAMRKTPSKRVWSRKVMLALRRSAGWESG